LSKLLEVKEQFEELQNKYQEYLPKLDAGSESNPLAAQVYMLEAFYLRRN
jgi:hypothetical protein